MSKWDQYGERFMELRSLGSSYHRIASQMDISVTTAKTWGKRFSLEIQQLARARVAKFAEEHLQVLENRLILRSEMIVSMRDELLTRDLSDIDTATLLKVYLRYLDSAQKEVQPLRVEVNSNMLAYEKIMLKCAMFVEDKGS